MSFSRYAVHYADDIVQRGSFRKSDVPVSQKSDGIPIPFYDSVNQVVVPVVLDKCYATFPDVLVFPWT